MNPGDRVRDRISGDEARLLWLKPKTRWIYGKPDRYVEALIQFRGRQRARRYPQNLEVLK